jgi:hypothetical protein
VPLSTCLQFQAQQITKYGAHSLRKNQLRHLVKATFNSLADSLLNLLELWSSADKISQPIALQLLFDCRYFAAATGTLIDQKYQNLEQQLEQLVSVIILVNICIVTYAYTGTFNKPPQKTPKR